MPKAKKGEYRKIIIDRIKQFKTICPNEQFFEFRFDESEPYRWVDYLANIVFMAIFIDKQIEIVVLKQKHFKSRK